ncbi:hypothetical protein [Klebsiella michiganensis]|uniref:hypothetical protein n=1 Tax=Klebsiella michiganensis TaxID=1134687 RepID=UPI000AC6BD68|nr:hypothetical protein [Klebsiella michiganensis]MCW9490409.1 hypothetical protein [Klebsiella michiganensis]
MKTKRNNPYPDETGNAVPVGEPGAGKTAFSSELIFARSDVTQLKRVYGAMSPGERDRLRRTMIANTPFRVNLKK